MIQQTCRLPDGRRLAWRETGRGRAIVLIHGWAMSSAVFTEIAELLGSDHRVLMPDLPGHGNSSPAADLSLARLAIDLDAWLNLLKCPTALICGWSLGGMVAIELEVSAGFRPAGLVLIATTPRFSKADDWPYGLPAAEVRLLERNLESSFQQTLGQFFVRMFAGEAVDAKRLQEIRRFAIYNEPMPDQAAVKRCLSIFSRQDQRRLLPGIACPVLVVHGAQDRITPAGAGRTIFDQVQRSRQIEYPDIGHAPFLSRPGQVVADIRDFEKWSL